MKSEIKTWTKKTLAAIEEKVQGKEISAEPAEQPQAQVIDLMEALKASLAKGERKPAKQSVVLVGCRGRNGKQCISSSCAASSR